MFTEPTRDKLLAQALVRWGLLAIVVLASLALASCGAGGGGGGGGGGAGEPTASPKPSTVTISEAVPPGSICPTGGQEIYYGIDDNGNGVLDESERDGSVTLCNGLGGIGVLIAITEEGPGTCPYGGDRVEAGLDNGDNGGIAGDGTLQSGEIDHTYWICGYGLGLSDGTAIASLSLPAGQVHHTRVAAAGRSYYQWTAPATGAFPIGLARTDSDLGWTLYSDAYTTALSSCDNFEGVDEDEFCLTPLLSGGATYYLAVTEQSGIPNLFDLSLAVPVLTAVDPVGRIYRIDPEFGTVGLLSQTGVSNLSAMAYLPQSGALRAGTGPRQDGLSYFHAVSPFTGQTSLIADRTTTLLASFMDMSVDPEDEHLYLTTRTNECDDLRRIDPMTGATVGVIGMPSRCNSKGLGMTFDGSGWLYLAADYEHLSTIALHLWQTDLHDVNISWYDIGALEFVGFDAAPAYIASMSVNPQDGATIYGIAVGDANSHYLVSMNVDWTMWHATATYVSTLPAPLDGLAYVGGGRVYAAIAGAHLTKMTGSISLLWRQYPMADSFTAYFRKGAGTIVPGNPATYTTVTTGLINGYEPAVSLADTYCFLLTAIRSGAAIASAPQLCLAWP